MSSGILITFSSYRCSLCGKLVHNKINNSIDFFFEECFMLITDDTTKSNCTFFLPLFFGEKIYQCYITNAAIYIFYDGNKIMNHNVHRNKKTDVTAYQRKF